MALQSLLPALGGAGGAGAAAGTGGAGAAAGTGGAGGSSQLMAILSMLKGGSSENFMEPMKAEPKHAPLWGYYEK